MDTIISIGVSEDERSLIVQTSIEDPVELIGILEMVKMQILNGSPKMSNAPAANLSSKKTEA